MCRQVPREWRQGRRPAAYLIPGCRAAARKMRTLRGALRAERVSSTTSLSSTLFVIAADGDRRDASGGRRKAVSVILRGSILRALYCWCRCKTRFIPTWRRDASVRSRSSRIPQAGRRIHEPRPTRVGRALEKNRRARRIGIRRFNPLPVRARPRPRSSIARRSSVGRRIVRRLSASRDGPPGSSTGGDGPPPEHDLARVRP